ncbi:MAG: DNA polymerase/3'-5' exonuclease PolX [Planctomycetota bacterium]|nr:DNA polymerase/3'-5' exonuclease PolX [Planctomycetota bacterium]
MDRERLASALEECGLLLELKGENPFKTRAYANAGRIVRALEVEPAEWIESGDMPKTKGIGKALAEKIETLVGTGELPYLEDLRLEVPEGLREWLKIPGLGPKKARAIHLALEISTLGELEYACKENRLRDLEGFGKTSQAKILRGIERVRSHAGRFLQSVALEEAERLRTLLAAIEGVRRVEIAGSVRRRMETSKDIDLVVVAESPEAAMDAFAGDESVHEVTGRGDTKCSVVLKSGPSADLRVVSEAAFPFTLMYFTGSKDHNVAIRARAQSMRLKLNEYALEPVDGGDPPVCGDEAAIYAALGLAWIPPELREDRGEIELAEANTLPALLEIGDLRGVLHCHSSWSDGSATIEEMAEAARERGWSYLGLCDHSQAAAYAGGLDPARVIEQHVAIDELNARFAGEFTVLKGIEVDVLADGALDFDDETMARFDLVVASIHSRFGLPRDEQTKRLRRAVASPWVDVVGHPTGRLLLARDGYAIDLRAVLSAAVEHGVAVEVNAHPRRLDLDWRELAWGLPRGLVTSINPDAHRPEGLDDVRYGVGTARKAGVTPDRVLNAWPLARLQEWLGERKARAAATAT